MNLMTALSIQDGLSGLDHDLDLTTWGIGSRLWFSILHGDKASLPFSFELVNCKNSGCNPAIIAKTERKVVKLEQKSVIGPN